MENPYRFPAWIDKLKVRGGAPYALLTLDVIEPIAPVLAQALWMAQPWPACGADGKTCASWRSCWKRPTASRACGGGCRTTSRSAAANRTAALTGNRLPSRRLSEAVYITGNLAGGRQHAANLYHPVRGDHGAADLYRALFFRAALAPARTGAGPGFARLSAGRARQ